MFLQKIFSHSPSKRFFCRYFSSHAPTITADSHHDVAHHEEHGHGHGHGHHAPYDWRDDPKVNKELEEDIRDRGWNPAEYTFPNSCKMEWFKVFPDNYDPTNLKQNFYPERKKNDIVVNPMKPPYWDLEGDMAHEADYESEDMDFQAESFKLQHFKKQGPLTPWIIAGFLPLIFFWAEFILQHYPDEDYWRFPVPPPLDFPDSDDTDDTETWKDYHDKEGRYYVDTGIIGELWYDIKDGKKVYNRFAGVNQPLPL